MMKILPLLLSLLLPVPGFAALDFNGTTDKITVGSVVVSTAPMTFCAWFNRDDATGSEMLVEISDSSSGTQAWRLHTDDTDVVQWWVLDTAGVPLSTSTTYTATTWRHACGVEVSNVSRAAFLDGGGKTTDTTDLTPTSLNNTSIGIDQDSSPGTYPFNGKIAEVAIWNRALSDAEVLSLSKGFSPNCFPRGLVNYTNLVRDVKDQARAVAWATTGTTVTAHPRIIYCH